MNPKSRRKYKRILNHLKLCLGALKHGRLYWENGEVIRFHIDFGPPLTRTQLEARIDRQRQMLAAIAESKSV